MGILNRIRKSGKPPVQPEPLSVSGRGHVDGFLNLEELNVDLQGRQGLEIFDRMFRTDADVRQVMALVCSPIVAGTWEISPAGGATASQEEIDDAAFIRWALFENMSPTLRGHLQEALPILFRSGFAPFEKVWEVTDYEDDKVTVPRTLQVRLPRTIWRWKQDAWGNLEAIEQYLPVPRAQVIAGPNVELPGHPGLTGPSDDTTGGDDTMVGDSSIITDTRDSDYRQTVWLPTSNLLYYRVGAEGDNWEGVSLLRPAYKHWLMKDAIERMDAIAQEREAMGIPTCYPPMGATPDQFTAMEQILQNIRSNAQGYVMMPGPKQATSGQQFGQGWLLEFLNPGSHGTGRDPQPSLKYHTDKIAAAFIAEFVRLGHSLTGGNRGLGETQRDPFLVGVEAIVGLIEDILNDQLVAPLMAYNRPNAIKAPRLKMSLVDSTSLTQLADFILKLVQVGALIPDQELEDFVRARADLPAADPEAVQDRAGLDQSLRREIVMGKNGNSDSTPIGTDAPAGSSTGGSASGSKPADNKKKAADGGGGQSSSTPTSAHDALTQKAIRESVSQTLDRNDAPPYLPDSPRIRWRPQAPYELTCDLDGIEDHFDSASDRLVDACGPTLCTLAREMAEKHPKRPMSHPELQTQIHRVLDDAYGYGQQTVSDEIEKQSSGDAYQLAAPSQNLRGSLDDHAKHATSLVLDQMHHAVAHAHLRGDQPHRKQRQAETAGNVALKTIGSSHVPAMFNLGRSDRILDASGTWGVRYTAILDNNTCDDCRAADDGKVRRLDDPVRLAHQPPNADCDSVASGRNMCRCFEIPEPMAEE